MSPFPRKHLFHSDKRIPPRKLAPMHQTDLSTPLDSKQSFRFFDPAMHGTSVLRIRSHKESIGGAHLMLD